MRCSRTFALILPLLAARLALAEGRQLTGQFAPANTPALPPEEALKKFVVPDGFEVRLFAAEPDVINPVAMTWDERGRLWVVELYEYPLGAKPGTKPRDRIKILEDTDGDGRADKVTVFADGLNLATGLQLGYGGVFVGQAPDLLFLEDTNHDDVADKRTVLMTGFGLEDRHELLNGFTWGPDGWLYMTHGVFTHSKVRIPEASEPGVEVNAAVARYQPRTKQFEVFADGTSNPWGVDFDRSGNAFVSACVLDHLFHMAPGGIYVKQGGAPVNPYSYELLPSIVDHKHYMAAYAGVQIYQGDQFPAEWRGEVLMGNIHQNAINHDHLTPNGSSFKASARPDFLTTSDGWFRPVSEQVGPDGALWVMDWCDKYPCYQNAQADPEGVDRERGRIWRVVYTGKHPGAKVPSRPEVNMDFGKLSTEQLVQMLAHPNIWQRRMGQRLLSERRDPASARPLRDLLASGKTLETRLSALWTLHSSGQLEDSALQDFYQDKEPAIRAWVARLTGERRVVTTEIVSRLTEMGGDPDPTVRLAVATAAREFVSGSLTVDTPVPPSLKEVAIGRILARVVETSADAKDPLIPFMIWEAAEPGIAEHPEEAFHWLLDNGSKTLPLSAQLERKVIRRVCDCRDPKRLDLVLTFAEAARTKDTTLAISALDGLLEGLQGNLLKPATDPNPLLDLWIASNNPDLAGPARRLGTLWGNQAAIQATLNLINDTHANPDERGKAVQVARKVRSDDARAAVANLLSPETPEPLEIEAIRALGELGGNKTGDELIQHWKSFTPESRRATAEVLVSRHAWMLSLLSALESKDISPNEIPVTAIRMLTQSSDSAVRERAVKDIGRVRPADADKLKLIAQKKKMILGAPSDLQAGHEVAKKTCFVCHKLYGEGADVGPDLTGVGRSTLDALLANVIDPNQVVGKGYENVEVETKDGRSLSGRMVENTDIRVRILSSGPKEEIISKSDIASLRVSELSVMPEGLEQMPDADFRNLVMFILNPPQDKK
ncbi:MAG TPA: PVC-type heme-binding CxxCH protein [Verrucomicrobiae bacterium]|nr:PVC-type heme-binding CxxCH protein [Verrucomicrobiae bacterium]